MNESEQHIKLKAFAKKMLNYMGVYDVTEELTVRVKETLTNQFLSYRVDVVGFRHGRSLHKDNVILVEIGNNHHDRINNLRAGGFLVWVIPYDNWLLKFDLCPEEILNEYQEKF